MYVCFNGGGGGRGGGGHRSFFHKYVELYAMRRFRRYVILGEMSIIVH